MAELFPPAGEVGIIQEQGREAAFCPGLWLSCAGSVVQDQEVMELPNLDAVDLSLSQLTIQPGGMGCFPHIPLKVNKLWGK